MEYGVYHRTSCKHGEGKWENMTNKKGTFDVLLFSFGYPGKTRNSVDSAGATHIRPPAASGEYIILEIQYVRMKSDIISSSCARRRFFHKKNIANELLVFATWIRTRDSLTRFMNPKSATTTVFFFTMKTNKFTCT